MITIPNGIWPTMITPFTSEDKVDYDAIEKLVEWYIHHHVNGIFAVCQSSEMFKLRLDERIQIARYVKEITNERIPVIASGHISESFEDQIEEINAIAQTGVDAVVLVTNRLAKENESDKTWKENLEILLNKIPDEINLGFYECPYPYKRLISPDLLKWCAETERFLFLKDTSCDLNNIRAKLDVIRNSSLKLFNANTATLYDSLKEGVAGYSGVMANFHPDLYVWLFNHWENKATNVDEIFYFLSLSSLAESNMYPINAKYILNLEGVKINLDSRLRDKELFNQTMKLQSDHLFELTNYIRKQMI